MVNFVYRNEKVKHLDNKAPRNPLLLRIKRESGLLFASVNKDTGKGKKEKQSRNSKV